MRKIGPIFIVLGVALLLTGCKGGGKNKQKNQNYKSLTVARGNLQLTVLATGNVQPQNQLWSKLYQSTPLLAPQDGQIIWLPTVPGQVVNTGTTLMILSDHLIVNTQVDETDL